MVKDSTCPQSPFEHEFFLWIYSSCLQRIRLLQFHLYHILHILQTWYTGLLHASRTLPLKKYHICINSVAPSMVPTHITGGYLEEWIREGHCFNTTEDVAWVIAQMANDEKMHSKCVMVVGGKM